MPNEVAIQAESLTKNFGDLHAVSDLSFRVHAGEIYGLLGPNGAGKTTALRMLAGLLLPSAGRALIDGIDVAIDAAEAKRRLGLLTATTGLYPRLTVRELLSYFGGLYDLDREHVQARIDELSRMLDMVPLLDRRCEALSTGERQRVSVARAALHDPVVLIFDEPTSGLDVLASRFLREFMYQARARGRAVLFSTHYLTEAELLCDRIGLLHRGTLLREGTPESLKADAQARSLEEAFLKLVDAPIMKVQA